MMSQTSEPNDERPCLHCLIGDLIDDYYGEFRSMAGERDTIDTDELLSALAKTFAELTYDSDAAQRQRMMGDFLRDVSKFETEFKEAQVTEIPASDARH
jgi:hypothetical protein